MLEAGAHFAVTNFVERRNNARRADTVRRVAERLAQSRDGLSPADLSAEGLVVGYLPRPGEAPGASAPRPGMKMFE